ncbi:unnamed protein product [Phytophthora lilii]|uniref:Unnamed protein product n=1 Tax=Phytophthora lilii TaxID=2077276 RepID=A0A9W6X6G6_9STRA|nr:unnamed protein product [Phytophthora lilii]
MADELSEYEAKRLRRIEENRRVLQALHLPALGPPEAASKSKKRKREEEKPLEPRRKSSRQHKLRKLERQRRRFERHLEKQELKKLRKLQKKELKQLKKERKLELKQQDGEVAKESQEKIELPQVNGRPMIRDWRTRRKLRAQTESKVATLHKRMDKKEKKLKEQIIKEQKRKDQKIRRRECKLRSKMRAKEKFEQRVRAREERLEERERWRAEALEKHLLEKERRRQERKRKFQEKQAVRDKAIEEILKEREEMKRREEIEEQLSTARHPVQEVRLPFVRISSIYDDEKMKPQVLTPLLKIDPNPFHAFSLGKQFLPPCKRSVMQALCPGGFSTVFDDDADIHLWKNAITLFVDGTTGVYYHYLFEEKTIDGREYVFFRWSRTRDVTPMILWRLSQVQRGKEELRVDENYYNNPNPNAKPEQLLLFIQYPKVSVGPLSFSQLGML